MSHTKLHGQDRELPGNQLITPVCFRACSYEQKLSHLARRHFDMRDNLVLFIVMQECYPAYREKFSALTKEINNESFTVKRESSGYVVFVLDKIYLGHRDLACQQATSLYPGKLFVSYDRN